MMSKEKRASGMCSAHQFPHPGERDYTPDCPQCYPRTSNSLISALYLLEGEASSPIHAETARRARLEIECLQAVLKDALAALKVYTPGDFSAGQDIIRRAIKVLGEKE